MSFLARLFVQKNTFPAIASKFPNAVAGIMNNAITSVVYQADPLTPVDTGALRANKTIKMAAGGNPSGSVTWNQSYAIYQEMGTVYVPAKHFAQGAVDAVTPGYLADLGALEGRL